MFVLLIAQPYNPDSKVTFLALSKLEGLANISVLTAIENNAEKFMDKAGFQLVYCCKSRNMNVRLAYEYIESWQMEKNPFYKPTWSGLIAVLGTIGLESLANRIDGILKETSPPAEHLDEHKHPENGILYNCDFSRFYTMHVYFYFPTAMELLMKLKGSLARLSKKKPKRLQKRVNACTSKCDEVLQKFRIEKMELERELESKNACIDNLTKRLGFYRQLIRSAKGETFFWYTWYNRVRKFLHMQVLECTSIPLSQLLEMILYLNLVCKLAQGHCPL